MSRLHKTFGLIIYLFLFFTFTGCNKEESKPDGKINITVSIVTYADFVKNIGGDKVKINTMIPANSNPHDYEPIPSQITDLAKSSLYFRIGARFTFEDVLLEKINGIKNNLTVIDCSEGIQIINKDPHVWLGINEAKIIAENIYEGLKKYSPNDSLYFKQNYLAYVQKLTDADIKLKESFAKLSNRYILVYHPAWTYFFKDYNLNQIGIEKNGKEPNAQDLKEIIQFAKDKKVTTIFVEPQFNKDAAESIAKQLNAKVDVINNLPENYLQNLNVLNVKFTKSNL